MVSRLTVDSVEMHCGANTYHDIPCEQGERSRQAPSGGDRRYAFVPYPRELVLPLPNGTRCRLRRIRPEDEIPMRKTFPPFSPGEPLRVYVRYTQWNCYTR